MKFRDWLLFVAVAFGSLVVFWLLDQRVTDHTATRMMVVAAMVVIVNAIRSPAGSEATTPGSSKPASVAEPGAGMGRQ